MTKCPFHQIQMHRDPGDAADAPLCSRPWCSHSHSPVTFLIATETVGPAEKLTCDGDLAKCQVQPELRPPPWLTS